jgi:hypothetical protein
MAIVCSVKGVPVLSKGGHVRIEFADGPGYERETA